MKDEDRATSIKQQEAVRRADIIRRYVGLARPTEADAERAAASLGLTVRRLHMLALSWRTHGTTSMRLGELRHDARARDEAVAAAEGPLELDAIREAHRVEVARRVRVIGRYLRTGTSDRATADVFAAEYGTGYNTFRRAVTAWMISRDPAKLPGVAALSAAPKRTRSLDPGIEAMLADAIADLGPDATGTAIQRRLVQLCNAAGLERPSLSVVYDRLLKARSGADRRKVDLAICIDHVAVEPMAEGDASGPVTLTLLFGASSGTVYEHRLDVEPPSALSAAIVTEHYLRRGGRGGGAALLEIEAPPGDEWDALLGLLEDAGVAMETSAPRSLRSSKLAFATFGNRLGELGLQRINARMLRGWNRTGRICPHLRRTVSDAVARHNGDQPTGNGPPIVDAASSIGLADRLAEFGRSFSKPQTEP